MTSAAPAAPRWLRLLATAAGAAAALAVVGREARAQAPTVATDVLAASPLRFVANDGVWPAAARFAVLGGPTRAFVTADGFRVAIERRGAGRPDAVAGAVVAFACGRPDAVVGELPVASTHRVLGAGGASGASFARVRLAAAWPGVDVVLRSDPLGGAAGALAYDLECAAAAALDAVEIVVTGATALRVTEDGQLAATVALGAGDPVELTQRAPVSWWLDRAGARRPVTVAFELRGADRFGFRVADAQADPDARLLVDPGLAWSTYLGGGVSDEAFDVAHLPGSGTWVAGWAGSSDFPTTPGAFRSGGQLDAFAARFDPSGRLVWATYFGGSEADEARAIAVERDGSVWIGGWTSSLDLPVTADAVQPTFGGRNPLFRVGDGFVARLSADGARLRHASYFGGDGDDYVEALHVGADGHLTIAGYTDSTNLVTTPGAFQRAFASQSQLVPDGFVARFAPGGAARVWSTYVGGSVLDYLIAMDVAADGSVLVGGWTGSPDFPTDPLAFQPQVRGQFDGFVCRLAADGSRLLASTLLGGEGTEQVRAVAAGPGGEMFVAGRADRDVASFPVTPGAFQPFAAGGQDAFVAWLSNDGRRLRHATLLGGSGDDRGEAIAVVGGRVTVGGVCGGQDFPVGPLAVQPSFGGGTADGFVASFDLRLGGVRALTFHGGASTDRIVALAPDAATGAVAIAGGTFSADLPVTAGAPQPVFGGGSDALVALLDVAPDRGIARVAVDDAFAPARRVVAAGGRAVALSLRLTADGIAPLEVGELEVAVAAVDAGLAAVLADLTLFEDLDGDRTVTAADRALGSWVPPASGGATARAVLATGGLTVAPAATVRLVVVATLAAASPAGAELVVACDPLRAGRARFAGLGLGAAVDVDGPSGGARVIVAAERGFDPAVTPGVRPDVTDVRRLVLGVGALAAEPRFDADGDGVVTGVDVAAAIDRALERAVVAAVPATAVRGGVLRIGGFDLPANLLLRAGGIDLPALAVGPRLAMFAVPEGLAGDVVLEVLDGGVRRALGRLTVTESP